MKKLFLLHAIIEMLAGVLLIFKPEWLLQIDGQSVQTLVVSKLYAVVAFTFGTLSYLLYTIFEFNQVFKKIILLVMFFHLMIAFQMYAAYTQGNTPNLGAFGLHISLALIFLVGYMSNPNAFE